MRELKRWKFVVFALLMTAGVISAPAGWNGLHVAQTQHAQVIAGEGNPPIVP